MSRKRIMEKNSSRLYVYFILVDISYLIKTVEKKQIIGRVEFACAVVTGPDI